MLLSIITVCYNAQDTILDTVRSIVDQTWKDFEYIIIDGGSTDETISLIQPYQERINRLISEPDEGIYHAMNKGLENARGDYVLFINSGDHLKSNQTLSDIFRSKERPDIFYGETAITDINGNHLGTRSEITSRKLPNELQLNDFLKGQVVSHQSFIVKRAIAPFYNTKYKCSADIDWMMKAVSRAKHIVNSEMTISRYLMGGFSDNKLMTCWSERFIILLDFFPLRKVLSAHITFALRFIKIGRYQKTSSVKNE